MVMSSNKMDSSFKNTHLIYCIKRSSNENRVIKSTFDLYNIIICNKFPDGGSILRCNEEEDFTTTGKNSAILFNSCNRSL